MGEKGGRGRKSRIKAEWEKVTGDKFPNSFSEVYTCHHPELGVWEFDDTGTINAVYEFHRGLGVRWCAPGELGKVVPQQTTGSGLALRRFSYSWEDEELGKKAIWGFRPGLNRGADLIGITQSGHGMKFVTMRDEMKAAHPEMDAIWDGKRAAEHKDAGTVTLTLPVLMEKHLKYVRAVFDRFKEQAISLDPVGGMGRAIRENDKEFATPERGISGVISYYVWSYIDKMAREIRRSDPDRPVTGSAYQLARKKSPSSTQISSSPKPATGAIFTMRKLGTTTANCARIGWPNCRPKNTSSATTISTPASPANRVQLRRVCHRPSQPLRDLTPLVGCQSEC